MKKKLYLGILIICLVSFCNRAQAQTFEMDGIYYSVIGADNTAVEVVSPETGTTYEGDIAIPASVFYGGETYWVTRIGDGAFQVCYNLTSIELPAGLTSIGWDAFFGGQTVLRRFSWRTSCMFAMAACLLSP